MRGPDFYTAVAPMAFIAGFGALRLLVIQGKAQPHVAGALAVVLVICGVLLGYLHQRASLWLAGSTGEPVKQ